ncbi:circularly permuted type 2 ATP-grasp protein [Methylibium rhizosphaerae]|uniref:circularly permuted type 2 ATP-grasp protein n=1 Tax=Methylibium rhizosphaerae TaxID=2570323 RepID=UPI00112C939D|nr:circularly permuted type 2 ATP-grasp protein [Methylibium rhizosphaerae]
MQQSTLEFDTTASFADAAAHAVLHAAKAADAGHYDELIDASGLALRPAWREFVSLLGPEGLGSMERRHAQIERQIHENGVTYNVFSDSGGPTRPWSLGLLPFLIEPADWRHIEAGVAQRAELLQAVLADVYGPQQLLHEGLLPSALVQGHPGYLRALQGVVPVGGQHLHIVAFDLARGPDASWWVVGQRTQSPSGLGYVMENRLITSRLFPEAFRELRVQHLASGYRRLLDTLQQLATPCADGHAPRLALLTPGPYSETYFEHAYLARYLGLPLVEGGDLTVRDDRLYLKTVQGLEPVHGLLRRLDDDYCDPLELRADSTLGVPGLLQVIRAGRVVVTNALGAGFLESPAVQGFLPAVAERLLGAPLSLPGLPTWWCGERAAWDAARDSGQVGVVRATYPRATGRGVDPGIGAPLNEATRAEWRRRIEADPDAYTLRGYLPFSQTPWWAAGQFLPRTAMLRVYAIADAQGGWKVLPGGMTRIAQHDPDVVSMQHGGSSLDTWVMTDGPVDTFSMLQQRLRIDDLAGRARPVSSRTAENLFWMGRYTERTEQLVRLTLATSTLVDEDDDTPEALLDAVTELARNTGLAPFGSPSLTQAPRIFERAVVAALADAQGERSIAFNLASLERAAGALRDRLSPEHWRLVRKMGEDFEARMAWVAASEVPGGAGFAAAELQEALEHLADQLAAVTGAQTDRMTRDDGWRLLTVGRLTERLVGMASTLQAFFAGRAVYGVQGFDMLLSLFDSTITFRARYQRRQDLLALVDLVVMDESNPRALACVLRRLRAELRKLPQAGGPVEGLLALLPQEGAGATLDELQGRRDRETDPRAPSGDAHDDRILALCERLMEAGARLSDEVGRRYFAHADGYEQHLSA